VTRILACTGKIYYDLVAGRGAESRVAIVRIEQLYPFAAKTWDDILAKYPNAKELQWVQEEPQNMGAWTFIRPFFEAAGGGRFSTVTFVGREPSASPATGSAASHKLEQETIISAALAGL